jgi:hypothetical protein
LYMLLASVQRQIRVCLTAHLAVLLSEPW